MGCFPKCSIPRRIFFVLPGKAERQLNLPRVEDGTRRSIGRVRRTFLIEWSSTTVGRATDGTQVGSSIGGVVVVHVERVQQVEALCHGLQVQAFPDSEDARDAQVD